MIHTTSVMTIEENTSNITFNAEKNDEMLKITSDGFYVRGVKLEQDEQEARRVYDAFHSWLMWITLNRYK